MKRLVNLLFPIGSFRRKALKKLLRKLHIVSGFPATYYNTWVHQKNEHPALAAWKPSANDGPLISIVVPAYNTPASFLHELVYSIASQAYPNWELILIDASTDAAASRRIEDCARRDERIRVTRVQNRGIAANTNVGIQEAQGEFVSFVDHDDILDPFALQEVVAAIRKNSADIVYTDEDKVSEDGEIYFDPHYKPDWSPDLFTHVNYVNHLTTVKKSLLEKTGPLDPSKDGAQDYDLLLRLFDTHPVVCHIPKVLYHWRAARNSTAQNFASKTNVTRAGQRALEEHFGRQNVDVKVRPKDDRPGFYEIKPQPYADATLIITPFGSDALLRLYTELLLHHTSLKIMQLELIVPEGVVPPKLPSNCVAKSVPVTPDYFRSALKMATSEQLIIINAVALPYDKGWLNNMTALLRIPHIAAAAPLLVHHGGLVEDCGLVRVSDKQLAPLFKGLPYKNNQTYFGNTDWVRNVDALTGNFVVTRTSKLRDFMEHSLFNEDVNALFKSYTLESANSANRLHNTIFSDVVFDNHSIRLQPPMRYSSYFNPNLVGSGHGFELYTPEAAALNILMRLKEDILYGEVHEAVVKY